MKRVIFFSMLLMAACTDKQEVITHTSTKRDSFAAPQVTVLADLPDSLHPKITAITTKPVRRIVNKEPKPINANGGKANFTNFSINNGLTSNLVASIITDRTGNIWIGTISDGVSSYDGKSFANFTTAHGLPSNVIASLYEDKAGNIWFGTMNGVSRYDGKMFVNFSMEDGLAQNVVKCILEDGTGNMWFGTSRGGVSRYNGKSFTNFNTDNGLLHNRVNSMCEDKAGNIWFGTSGGVCRYDSKIFTNFTTDNGLAGNSICDIYEDKAGNMWFGTYHGVSRYDGKSFTNFTTTDGLASNKAYSINEDKTGNIWIGTRGGGVCRYNGKTFTNFTNADGLPANVVTSIYEDKSGEIWFGTPSGVSRYDSKSFTNFTVVQGLPDNYVFSINEDNAGNMWFGTVNGLSRYDGRAFTNFTTAQGLASNFVLCTFEDTTGNLWFGTEDGLSIMSITRAKQLDKHNNSINTEDSSSQLFQTFSKTGGLFHNTVTNILQLSNGKMAIGTFSGICMFNLSIDMKSPENIEIYNTNSGYPLKRVDEIHAMILDSRGVIWVSESSDMKLMRFDYSALVKDTPLPTIIIKDIKINEEAISWNSLKGKKSILKIKKVDSGNLTPAYITEEVTKFGKELTPSERDTLLHQFGKIDVDSISPFYYVPQHLKLPYDNNHITIDFNAIETGRNFMVNYQYILEGYDDKWSPITKKGAAVYGNMSEGSYTFKVKAQSPEGEWCEPVVYSFKVLPPWYRTWWMYVLYILLFILALRSFIKWRERKLLAEKEKLEDTVMERTEELVQKNIIVEQEKQKSEDLLLNILPEEIAEELKEKGYSDAKMFDKVTVLFTDFVGFTKVSEHLTPQQLVKELDTCFKAFDGIMGKYHIEKIKTVGDAYLAVCGLPTADEQHAENVVKAAQDIKDFMLNRHAELGDKTFEVRIGVHSGEVVAGIVGVKKFAYDIWGDTVNTAARMESNSIAGHINISETTYELVKDKFTCTYRGEIEAKGKGQLKMYFVEG